MKKICFALLAFTLIASLFVLPSCGKAKEAAETLPQSISETAPVDETPVRLMALQGPTGMGLAKLYDDAANGKAAANYEFSLVSSTEITNIVAAIANNTCDIAAVPINLASTLYAKTKGGAQVICVNTLGVLQLLENGDSIHSVSDLRGKTIYATGQGSTPEYVLRYVLTENGIDPDQDVTIEYVADHTELAARMAGAQLSVGMLPEPNVSVVLNTNANFRSALDMTAEWNKISGGTDLVQGVFVARRAFIEEHPALVAEFLEDYKASEEFVNQNPSDSAALIVSAGILNNAKIAQSAIPGCNITFREGSEMKDSVSKCLEVLFKAAPASVGGALPADDFYYSR